jgi:hypothetical protein
MAGRGKSARNQHLIASARAILEEIAPASVRAVCYRLFIAGEIPSMSLNDTKRVSAQLVDAREQGLIPWDWITDSTRSAEGASVFDDPEDFIDAALASYRRDFWRGQPVRLQVWSEKATIRGAVEPVLLDYGVRFRFVHGWNSATIVHEIAVESQQDPRPLHVLYVGDWDPSGMYMSEQDLPGRLARYGGAVTLHRIALATADVRDAALPSFPAESKRRDSRYKWFAQTYGADCWELDALHPGILRERVAAEITRYIDREAWERYAKVEAGERASLEAVLARWPGSIRGLVGK